MENQIKSNYIHGFENPPDSIIDQINQVKEKYNKNVEFNPYPPRNNSQSDLFSVGRVQFSLDHPLQLLLCNSHILIFLISPITPTPTTPPQLVRIDLSEPEIVDTIPLLIPSLLQSNLQSRLQQTTTTIHRIHCDPTGRHVLISLQSAQNYYVSLSSNSISQHRASTQNSFKKFTQQSVSPGPTIKLLSKLKGLIITSVGWHHSSFSGISSSSTKQIILGTSTGALFSTCLLDHHSQDPTSDLSITAAFSRIDRSTVDRYLRALYTLPDSSDHPSITGIWSDVWYQHVTQNRIIKRALVIVVTPNRLYQFVDQVGILKTQRDDDPNEEILEKLFNSYQTNRVTAKFIELPATDNSQLHVYNPINSAEGRSNSELISSSPILAWMTAAGIYSGEILHGTQEAGHSVIVSSELTPFPSTPPIDSTPTDLSNPPQILPSSIPIGFCPTEYHFVLLFRDRIQIICRLNSQVVHEETLDLKPEEYIHAITTDPVDQTYWLYSEESIFELIVKNESRDIWKVYLNKKDFDKALSHVHTPVDRDQVLISQADHYFETAKYIQAAQIYAQCSKAFEDVVLGFIDREERDALRYYLISRLERLKRQDLTQRMMLATWLTEIYLAKINELEDLTISETSADEAANIVVEQKLIEDELQQFLRTYKTNLDQRTTYDLITSHGRKDVMIYYANLIGDHQRIIRHYILEEDWKKAIESLSRQNDLELYYKFAPVLVSHDARSATTMFMRQPKLDVKRLLPALISPRSTSKKRKHQMNVDDEKLGIVIEYLKFTISRLNNSDAPIHNALLTLYATQAHADEGPLLRFLATTPDNPSTGKPFYDLDYALRICKANNKLQSCGLIYSKMGLYESSVDLALQTGDLELAKLNAEKAEDDVLLRKKLWLKIAEHVVHDQKDIKTAMEFLDSTDLLKVEDILPFFPDFVVIDEFKESICAALENYSINIQKLKQDMEESNQTAKLIEEDLKKLSSRFLVINQEDECCSCNEILLTRQFYLFPCQHSFHADCLIKEVMNHMPPHQLRRMLTIQNKLAITNDSKQQQSKAGLGIWSNNEKISSSSLLSDSKKLAMAGVQGLDLVRKMIIPDALVGVIGGGVGVIGSSVGALGGVLPISKVTQFGKPSSSKSSTEAASVSKMNNYNQVESFNKMKISSAKTQVHTDPIDKLKIELDMLLASQCPLCLWSLKSIDLPFTNDDEVDI